MNIDGSSKVGRALTAGTNGVFSMLAAVAGLLLIMLIPACASHPGDDQSEVLLSHSAPITGESRAVAVLSPSVFIEEIAMGAECGPSAITEAPLQDMACSGNLPEHLARFVRSMPRQHPLLAEAERERIASSRHSFKAVKGLGARHDILAVIHHYSSFWIRSFEGPNPDVTLYLVYGPECATPSPGSDATSERACAPASAYSRDYMLYRVEKGGAPRDVTSESAPPAPRLNRDERRRYGHYRRNTGEAMDSDVQMDVSRLAYVPVLRWVLRPVQEGEYTPPDMPSSDQRAFKDHDWGTGSVAHFGFLVWNGRRMELREKVPAALWPCRSSGLPECGQGYDSSADRYLD
jgi:hypothetical protein